MDELIRATAREMVGRLNAGEVSHAEVLDALEARVGAVDGAVNALPTLCFDRARVHAARIAALPVAERGVLGGLPVPIKDVERVAGVRSTDGSPIHAGRIPEVSDHVVERIEARGGVVYAKSNTPEFGAGGSTFNEVFGRTRNPWDLSRSAAGSSGGAAAALASGTAWVAQGSDMAGSLRSPASFCGVVGLRPAPGRVPSGPGTEPFATLTVNGPMARNVGDAGLLLDAMAGADPREPKAVPEPETSFRAQAEHPRLPRRVAFSRDLGLSPVDPEVAAICGAAARRFEVMGVAVEEAHPDFTGAHEAFQTLRAVSYAAGMEHEYTHHRALLKPDVVWNIERGLRLSGEEVARATRLQGRITAGLERFFQTYDLLLTPATIVPAFPVETRALMDCDGQSFETYIDWLAIVYAITLTSAPALSLPCGFTSGGLPVGLQMVAPFWAEGPLVSFAAALEGELGLDLGPIDPRA
jgi:amidase